MPADQTSPLGEMTARDALIVVDVQKDFCPGGALPVPDGDKVVPVINRIQDLFSTVIFTRDWHQPGHVSFSQNPQFRADSWPRHCLAGSDGAAFHHYLKVPLYAKIIDKGIDKDRDAYSPFEASDLADQLRHQQIDRVFVTGLATNYSVKATALAALTEGFQVVVVADACRGLDIPAGAVEQTMNEMADAGILIINSNQLPKPA